MILRPYQEEAADAIIRDLEASHRALCVLPCGSGKTEIMIEVARRLSLKSEAKQCAVLNKVKLYDQTMKRFTKAMPNKLITSVCGSRQEYNWQGDLVVGMIQTLAKSFVRFGTIFLDEAHNAALTSPSGLYYLFIEHCKKLNVDLNIIGFTATPFRATGLIYGEGKLFPKVSYYRSVREFIEEGFLVEPKLKSSNCSFSVEGLKVSQGDWDQGDLARISSDVAKVERQVEDALRRSEGRKKIVWLCCNIRHAELVKEIISRKEKAAIIHSDQAPEDRLENETLFEKTACRHLTFVTIVSEGYDYPPIDCIVLMRPTRSAVLYIQTVGRAMRLWEGKTDCLILDYGRVVEHCGPIDKPLILSMKKKEAKQQIKELEAKTKFCPKCLAYLFAPYPELCPDCGFEMPKPAASKKLVEKPEEQVSILSGSGGFSPAIQSSDVAKVTISKYISKAGNNTYRLEYWKSQFHIACVEYLMNEPSSYHYYKTLKRLKELGIYNTAESLKVINVPRRVHFKTNAQNYKEVVSLEFQPKLVMPVVVDGEKTNRTGVGKVC